jgi:hypothetical protein
VIKKRWVNHYFTNHLMEVNMSQVNTSQVNTVTVRRAFSKTVSEPRQLLTQDQADKCKSMAEAIRMCKKLKPDATNGEIARFLGIRPQWVFNVLANPPKRG